MKASLRQSDWLLVDDRDRAPISNCDPSRKSWVHIRKPWVRLEIDDPASATAQADVDHVTYFNFTAAFRWHFVYSVRFSG
ncbi:hypothetical protein [Pseudomonas palleroniana]|uniref:hypothetical protein n=1 Tax=Pseudomonas palleroniana TaxID=191390 RepID=UPI0018E69005|nr:hypothetical protein [Pseudomonas palleroniana]MBI6911074.1 hypothetical protein [Pseudomonas palleroniana]